MFRGLLVCLFAGCALAQQPLIYNRGILNAASFMPQRLPGGAIAQGSIFSIFGTNVGPSTPAQVSSFPLQTTFGGVSIVVSQGSTTVNAIPIYVSASQINAIMPSNAPLGMASVRVRANGFLSNPMTVVIAPSAVGIFTATGTGIGPGIVQNFISQTNQPINSATIAAQPGQTVILWGTGLGPVSADNVAPSPVSLPTKVEVSVGGAPATVAYSGRTPCCAGVDQIVFQVPANAPQGCWVPVYVRTGGTTVSNVVTMAITSDGSSCLNTASPLVNPGKYGIFMSLRVDTREDVGTRAPIDVTGDYATAVAYQASASSFPFNPVISWPPAGTCTTYSVKGDLLRGDTLPGAVPSGGTAINFGSGFNLSGPGGMKTIPNFLFPQPLHYLGGSVTGDFFTNTGFLQPGSYQVIGAGSSDVGSFTASASMPRPLAFSNLDQLLAIDRTQPLTLSWSGGSGTPVAVIGFGVDLPNDSTTVFGCMSAPGATSFTVPADILANVPATHANPLQSKSVIYLINTPGSGTSASINPSGLDAGMVAFQNATGKTVIFQ